MNTESQIPLTTLYADEAPSGYIEPPTSPQFHAGVEPEMTLPAMWWNYFTNLFTNTNIKAKEDITAILAELNNALTTMGITPDPEASTQLATLLQNDVLPVTFTNASMNANPYTTSSLVPKHRGNIAINTTTRTTWIATNTTAAANSWSRLWSPENDGEGSGLDAATAYNTMGYDLVIDSNTKLLQWQTSGTYEKVLIKTGTWTLSTGDIDLTARGTKVVMGESGNKLVFSAAAMGLHYTTLPVGNNYRMEGVTVEATGNSNTSAFRNCNNLTNCTATGIGTGSVPNNEYIYAFRNCNNLTNCIATGSGASEGIAFGGCNNLTNCTGTGTGTGTGSGIGFANCNSLTNCTGTGTGVSGWGFSVCLKMQQNKKGATSTTATYTSCYASAQANGSFACADGANGGFNS